MGFRFRKSFRAGSVKLNFSKSGVGYSIGGKGFRVTKKSNGGTRTTASIPGTGISYVKDSSKKEDVTMMKNKATKYSAVSGASGKNTKPKKPFYKKWWFWIIIILLLLGSCGDNSEADAVAAEPTEVTETFAVTTEVNEETTEATEPETTTEPTIEPATEPTTEPATEPTETEEPGITYVLNTNTKKFHYSRCSSADDIKSSNRKEVTTTREDLIAKGYDPCKRCDP